MKKHLTCPTFWGVVSLISLFICGGCGDAEDIEEATSTAHNALLNEPYELLENLKDKNWEKLKGEGWVKLTDEEVEAFVNLEIPQRWGFETKDRSLYEKYLHATYFQRFGDIPAVRYIVEFKRQQGKFTTPERFVAFFEAMYVLFPTANNRRSLEDVRKHLGEKIELRLLEHLRIKTPETWVERMHALLVKKHGDLPEIDAITKFLRKLELQLFIEERDCLAYIKAYQALYNHMTTASTYEFYALLEAKSKTGNFVGNTQSRQLEKYREARAKGRSFYDIDWDDD